MEPVEQSYFAVMWLTWRDVVSEVDPENSTCLHMGIEYRNLDVPKSCDLEVVFTKVIGEFFEMRPECGRETRYILLFRVAGNSCEYVDMIYRIGPSGEWLRQSELPAEHMPVNWGLPGMPRAYAGVEPL